MLRERAQVGDIYKPIDALQACYIDVESEEVEQDTAKVRVLLVEGGAVWCVLGAAASVERGAVGKGPFNHHRHHHNHHHIIIAIIVIINGTINIA